MRWYISYPVLAAGLAFGFETFYPSQPSVSVAPDRTSHELAAPEAANVVVASDIPEEFGSRLGAFSPGIQLAAAQIPNSTTSSPTSSPSVLDYLAQALSPSGADADPVPPAPQPITIAEWKSAIVRDVQPAALPVVAQPTEPITRAALARDIQRELQRVGCYLGEIDGIWGGGSKRAVLLFMDRVNASLPTREPDVFMLSLLRSQTAAVCGTSCPRGQSLTASGRCMPSTLVVQADGAAPNTHPDAWSATIAQARDRGPMPYGRMSIGGPKPDDVQELSAGWSRVTSTTTPSDPQARTAALDYTVVDDPGQDQVRQPNVATSSFDTDAVADPEIRKRNKPTANRAKTRDRPRYTSSYRQVQHLFQHPLGRM